MLTKAEAQERNQEIVRRLKAGETLEAIAVDWDLSRERVRQIGRHCGHVWRQTRRRRMQDATYPILRLAGTMSTADIAARVKLSPSSVQDILRWHGKKNPRPRGEPSRWGLVIAYIMQGEHTAPEIAALCNVHRKCIYLAKRYLDEKGLKVPPFRNAPKPYRKRARDYEI